jgi:hypothetical protein
MFWKYNDDKNDMEAGFMAVPYQMKHAIKCHLEMLRI